MTSTDGNDALIAKALKSAVVFEATPLAATLRALVTRLQHETARRVAAEKALDDLCDDKVSNAEAQAILQRWADARDGDSK